MKVLVLGMPRTGTQSIADALDHLGFGPVYHMREVGKNKHQALWIEALEAKFEGKGEPFGRQRFDEILSGYESLADYPASIFPAELAEAYPDLPIILTTRPTPQWLASMESTLWHHHQHTRAAAATAATRPDPSPSMAPLANLYHRHCWGDDLPRLGAAAFEAHNEGVRALAASAASGEEGTERSGRRRRFLEFRPGDGWEVLCGFLGVPVPRDGEGNAKVWPRSDDWKEYKEMALREREENGV
ncbi:hypothetical protein F4778DRAFT_739678 [Xylariomycetidae sp. FL2044]|nr:hypothetical protein F4778DRAFT_739678 [Xylariomycetidae sp. FL2044]